MRLQLPVVLEPIVESDGIEVRGNSIGEVFEAAFAEIPALRHHLIQESGELRPHILCIHNGVNIERGRIAETPLSEGDEILIHQAISGG